MRKLVYFVACSVDGFIARPDGGLEDFHLDGDHLADLFALYPETVPEHLRDQLGVVEGNRRFDTVLMGRRTYEVGADAGFPNPYPHMKQYVVSSTLQAAKPVEVWADGVVGHVRNLKQEEGGDIWLCGGSSLASALFSELDEVVLKVNPFLMGQGIPLFREAVERTALKLTQHVTYANGFQLQRFKVVRAQS